MSCVKYYLSYDFVLFVLSEHLVSYVVESLSSLEYFDVNFKQ